MNTAILSPKLLPLIGTHQNYVSLLKLGLKIKESNSKSFYMLSKGESIFLKADCKYEITLLKKAIIYKAKVGE